MFRLLLALLLIVPTFAGAQESVTTKGTLYRWKDAQGTIHYSDRRPVTGTAYNESTYKSKTGVSTAVAAPEPAKNVTTPCDAAKRNASTLGSDEMVMMDTNGDGQADPLSAADRAKQLALAKSQVDAFCKEQQAAPATDAPAAPVDS